ncbi:hypothetical protein JCM6882_007026 [Rhodosporidiobolus microsporus]
MEESVDGLALPTFSGRLSSDWDAHEARLTSWLSIRGVPLHAREAAEALELSLTAQAALSYEQEAGLAERRVWEDAVAWCREKWAGEGRKRLAAAAAVNRLNSRSFRERGSRRENVKDLISELELLFLQAGVVDDEAQRRAFIGCFFEFPRALHRLSRSSSYADACAKALEWEGEMVRKEREALTSHLRPAALSQPHHQQRMQRDPSSTASAMNGLERPVNPTPGGSSPALARAAPPSPSSPNDDVYFRPDDLLDPTDALVEDKNAAEGYTAERRSSLALPRARELYPARSVETLHAYPSQSSSVRAQLDHERQPRAHSSLAAYPSPDSLPARLLPSLHHSATLHSAGGAYKSSCAGTRHRSGLPSFDTPPSAPPRRSSSLHPPTTPDGSLRIHTPPFVTEATSFVSSASVEDGEGGGDPYAQFPYPSRPSPTPPSFQLHPHNEYATRPISASSAGAWAQHLPLNGRGNLRGRSKPPVSPSAKAHGAEGGAEKEGGPRRKGTLLGALFGKKGTGHGRRRSVDWAASTGGGRSGEEGGAVEEGRWMTSLGRTATSPLGVGAELGQGRPPKRRAGLALGGGGLPP